MLDIGLPPVEVVHLGPVRVKPQHRETHLAEPQHQGQPHIAQANHPDQGFLLVDFLTKCHVSLLA